MSDFDITPIDTPTTVDKRLDFETGSCGSYIEVVYTCACQCLKFNLWDCFRWFPPQVDPSPRYCKR